ncbi:MAG: hypothetical protein ACRDHZ_00180 [Ktedonobacteraceae bacterium]
MGLRRDELLKRVGRRENLKQDWKRLNQPAIDASDEDWKEYNKQTTSLKKEYFSECHGVNADMRLLDQTCNVLATQIMEDRGMKPLDGNYNNTVRDEIIDEALEMAWSSMPRETRPIDVTPVQTQIGNAIEESVAEKNDVELPVITLPPANAETGEEIAPTIRYQALVVQAEAANIGKETVDALLLELIGEEGELDHAAIEELTAKLQETLAVCLGETRDASDILAELDAGINKENVERVCADRKYDECMTLFFKIQEYAAVNAVEQGAITAWLQEKGFINEDGGAIPLSGLVQLAERVIAWSKQTGEAVVEEIVNETEEDAPTAEEYAKADAKNGPAFEITRAHVENRFAGDEEVREILFKRLDRRDESLVAGLLSRPFANVSALEFVADLYNRERSGECTVEEIRFADQKSEVAEEPAKKPRKARTPSRRPGIKPNKRKR